MMVRVIETEHDRITNPNLLKICEGIKMLEKCYDNVNLLKRITLFSLMIMEVS